MAYRWTATASGTPNKQMARTEASTATPMIRVRTSVSVPPPAVGRRARRASGWRAEVAVSPGSGVVRPLASHGRPQGASGPQARSACHDVAMAGRILLVEDDPTI